MVVTRPEAAGSPRESSHRPLRVDRLGWAACVAAAAGFAACLTGWLAGGGAVSLPWAPTLGLRLDFSLDGLGALYGLLATGVGALVFAYGTHYLTLHLEHEQRSASERWRFWPWMALFAVAMVGLATAQELILWGAFTDILAGRIVDQTNTRWGKFRPYFLFCGPPLIRRGAQMLELSGATATGRPVAAPVLFAFIFASCRSVR